MVTPKLMISLNFSDYRPLYTILQGVFGFMHVSAGFVAKMPPYAIL